MRLIILALITLNLLGCASAEIPDFKAYITLPASGDGYYVQTVSEGEGRVPKAEWQEKSKHGVVLLSDDWQILRTSLLKNCLTQSCKTAVGTFDNLFSTIDSALKTIPINP